jgi:Tol biopolymer transport system component
MEPIPDDGLQRRTWLIVGVLSLVVVLVGVGVAFAILTNRTPANKAPSFSPAEETSSAPSVSTLATSSGESSTSVTTTPTSATDATTTATTSVGQIVRSGQIAFRQGGSIWVAGEDGSAAKKVTESASGSFSLSPDGRTLVVRGPSAAVDRPVLIDIATGARAQLIQAIDMPTWAPDSSWLAYTAGTAAVGYTIRRVDRDGSDDSLLVSVAAQPQISTDGARVAYTKSPQSLSTDPVRVMDLVDRSTHTVPNAQGATHFAWAAGGVLYFVKHSLSTGTGWLGKAEKELAKSSVVASLPLDANMGPGVLLPNPLGSKVLFAMEGDDGRSKMYLADVATKKISALATRRDAYPQKWLLDGTGLLYIDGNAIEKETPALYRMNIDGSHKTVVIQDVRL